MLEEIYVAGHAPYADPARSLLRLLEERPGQLHVVLITDPGAPGPDCVLGGAKSFLHLAFDDVHQHVENSSRTSPTRAHMEQVLSWVADKDAVVVACHAGVSRSAATAFLIAARAWGPAKAQHVLKSGVHWPNPALVRVMKEMFPGQGVGEAVEEWTDSAFKALAGADTSPDTQDAGPVPVAADLSPPGRPD